MSFPGWTHTRASKARLSKAYARSTSAPNGTNPAARTARRGGTAFLGVHNARKETVVPDTFEPTNDSRDRIRLARELAGRCPAELGEDIAVTGSAARGLADRASDVEIICWLPEVPDVESRSRWLARTGATSIKAYDWEDFDGTSWITCNYQETWVEIGWNAPDRIDAIVDDLLAARRSGHDSLQIASMLCAAEPLRTAGRLAGWQERLARYPPGLQSLVIARNTEVWSDLHVPMVRWTLAARRSLFPLTLRLTWDMQNVWAILHAINERWEPDYKWTSSQALDLPLIPDKFSVRLNSVFMLDDTERSVGAAFELILDTLALVPPPHDVSAARVSIDRAQRRSGP